MRDVPSLIFHHPFPIESGGHSGSRVRPYHMLRAFGELGYDVETVTGEASQRRRDIGRITRALEQGRRFDFVYSEAHTLPTLLTEKHHLPLHPRLDFGFFRHLKACKVPLGLFYRDVHWRFEHFRALYPPAKRFYTYAFYHYEFRQYRRLVDHLFVPTLAMAEALPLPWPPERVSALPPGTVRRPITPNYGPAGMQIVKLFYVGGVRPPLYDLTPLFTYVAADDRVRLTVCCQPDEWQIARAHYPLPPNIEVVHAKGDELTPLYEAADAVAILWKPYRYLNFAFPVKLVEAMSYGLPVITTPGTETSRFVQRERIGWTVASQTEFQTLVDRLLEHPPLLHEMYANVLKARARHSWTMRAKQVADTLRNLAS